MPRRVDGLEPLGDPEQYGPAVAGEIPELDRRVAPSETKPSTLPPFPPYSIASE